MSIANETKLKLRKTLRRVGWFTLLGVLVLMLPYYIYRTFTLSDGSRTGTLVQVSRTGVLFKTYEGQLHLAGSMQISEQSTWYFSVKNKDVYEVLRQNEGRMVQCYYKKLVNPFPWQGKSQYIVYKVDQGQ